MEKTIRTEVALSTGRVDVPVELGGPADATCLLVFGSAWGQGFESETDPALATAFQERGFATLRLNAITDLERELPENEVDWELMARRIVAASRWARSREWLRDPDVGLVGSSTGAAPALRAAVGMDDAVGVITRSGRLDYAPRALDESSVPVFQIVGSEDEPVLSINRRASERLGDRSDLWVVEGADHGFPSDEQVEVVADRVVEWFESL